MYPKLTPVSNVINKSGLVEITSSLSFGSPVHLNNSTRVYN